jgi:hypothetical protein
MLGCLSAYLWIAFNFNTNFKQAKYPVCLFKFVTKYPCPSCGSTRSAIQLFHGNFLNAVLLNPLGIISAALIILLPSLIIYDFIFKKKIFYTTYSWLINLIQKKPVAILLVVLILLNWIWNIKKNI